MRSSADIFAPAVPHHAKATLPPYLCPKASPVLTLRDAIDADQKRICELLREADMETLSPGGHYLIAKMQNHVVGFIRTTTTPDGSIVNPLIVDPAFQRRGIGRALMHEAAKRYGSLFLVARGQAATFYKAIGCKQLAWEEVPHKASSDCGTCTLFAQCKPVAFVYPVG